MQTVTQFLKADKKRIATRTRGKVIEAKTEMDRLQIVVTLEQIEDKTKDPYIKDLVRRLFEWGSL